LLSPNGDFRIDDTLSPLPPAACIGPMLLIRNAANLGWFAVGDLQQRLTVRLASPPLKAPKYRQTVSELGARFITFGFVRAEFGAPTQIEPPSATQRSLCSA
jgi:hypothetical protein